MLKRNLIIIAIISLSIIFSTDAFGQNNKRKRTAKKAKVSNAKQVVQYNSTDWDFIRRKNKRTNGQGSDHAWGIRSRKSGKRKIISRDGGFRGIKNRKRKVKN